MRLWRWRRSRPLVAAAGTDVLLTEELLRRSLDDAFVVRERQILGGAIVYRGRLLTDPATAVDRIAARFRPFGFTPFLRADGGDIVLQALPTVEAGGRSRVWVHVVLFALTCLSTLLAGTGFVGSPMFDAFRASERFALLAGVPFAATLLGILTVHEFGHYFTARHHRAAVTLPYFIPAPPPLFVGTLGAIIRMRSAVRDRNALFDIAAAGPLAGMAVALPALVLGLQWSTVAPAPTSGLVVFGESLLLKLFGHLKFGAVPDGMMVYTHPIADAAWFGFLVTAINLFPVGQLDGGRIAYALFGRRHELVGRVTVGLLFGMGVATATAALVFDVGSVMSSIHWFVWGGLISLVIGFHHSPPIDDLTPLTRARRAIGIACLILLVLLLPPVPIAIG